MDGKMRNPYKILIRKLTQKRPTDGKIILKWMLN
jgi:hypothetical protein